MCKGERDHSEAPGQGEICVWQASLPCAAREPLALTEAECRVAGSIHGVHSRSRYVVGRTLLRRRLGRLLGCDPLSVELVYGPEGKPALARPVLSFNVSHAGDLVLIAVSRPRQLGVDIEQIRAGLDLRILAEELLGPADRDTVTRAVARQGVRAFFRYWTRYEALVKARGEGLAVPLRELAEVAAGFEVQELAVAAGYTAAVAADGGPWHIVHRREIDAPVRVG